MGGYLAHRTTWRRKAFGLVFGLVAIQVVNLVRVVSLIYVRRWYPEIYESSHLILWQSLVVFVVVLLWIAWAAGSSDRRHAT